MIEISLTQEEFEIFSEICFLEKNKFRVKLGKDKNINLEFDDGNDALDRCVEEIANAEVETEPLFENGCRSFKALVIERIMNKFCEKIK